MLRSIGILFSVILLMTVTTQNGLNLVIYELAKPVIIENYCVNKEKPEMRCNGKCHLTTMLDAEENQNEDPVDLPTPEFKFQFSFFLGPLNTLLPKPMGKACQYAEQKAVQSMEINTDIFHPPRV